MIKTTIRLVFIVLFLLVSALCFGKTLTAGKGGKYASLQDAIDAAQSGDVVSIKSGTYSLGDSLSISEKSNLEIRGEGKVTIACTAYIPVIYISGSESITIRNIHGVHQVKDPSVGKGECGPGATIISAEESTDIKVIGCELNGCGQTGFESRSSYGIVLDGNYIHDNVNSAIALYVDENDEVDVTIKNNRLENNFGPVLVASGEGRLDFYFEDSDEAAGIVMVKNTWKNNDRMPRKAMAMNGTSVVFWGPPETYEDDNGQPVVSAGILDQDTEFPAGGQSIVLAAHSVAQFYQDGTVSSGYAGGDQTLTLADDTEVTVAAGGAVEFWESGNLKSAELDDGTVIQFDEDGNQIQDDNGDDNGQGYDDEEDGVGDEGDV